MENSRLHEEKGEDNQLLKIIIGGLLGIVNMKMKPLAHRSTWEKLTTLGRTEGVPPALKIIDKETPSFNNSPSPE